MTDEMIVFVAILVVLLVSDFVLFSLEHRRLEKQHKRHKEEIAELFRKYLG